MNLPRIQPVNPARIAAPFDHPDFLFELKHDGFRAVAYLNGICELVSRKGNMYQSFGRLTSALASLPVQNAILDGEIVCLDGDGRSQFLDLMRRRKAHAVFYAFDLLWLDGMDLRSVPLIERKRYLRRLVRRKKRILYADHVERKGLDFFRAVCARDCEGIVAKHKAAPYVTSPATWFKVLSADYSQKRGRREMFEGFSQREQVST